MNINVNTNRNIIIPIQVDDDVLSRGCVMKVATKRVPLLGHGIIGEVGVGCLGECGTGISFENAN